MTVKWPPTCIPMHFSASRSLTQPLLDCILYLTLIRYPYDPGTLASSAKSVYPWESVSEIQPIKQTSSVSDFLLGVNQMHAVISSRAVFPIGALF